MSIDDHSVSSITDDELLRRAVLSARDSRYRKGIKHSRWVAVMSAFCLGSTFAHQLCARFGIDPDEQVRR